MSDFAIESTFDTEAIEAALLELPAKVGGEVLRESLQAAGDVILNAMRTLAPERTDEPTPGSDALPPGFLRADLRTEVQIKPGLAPRVKVGPSKYTAHVAHWIEDGWQPTGHGKSRKGRKSVGARIAGKHFMASASDETRDSASTTLLEHLSTAVGQALNTEGQGPEIEYGGEGY